MAPKRGALLRTIAITTVFPSWEHDGSSASWLGPLEFCVFLEERYDYENNVVFWKVVCGPAGVGWADSRRFEMI